APSPGPISSTRSAGVGARRSAMLRATPASRRKCWPSARRLLASGIELLAERPVNLPHPCLGGYQLARVVDQVVGKPGLLVERHLASDPSPGVVRPEPAAVLLPRDLGGLAGCHDHEPVHVAGGPGLEQHRG